jgi:uncharacterized protein
VNAKQWETILKRPVDENEILSLNFLVEQAKLFPFIEALFLFGSRARGDFKKQSDFDILAVVTEGTSNHLWSEFTHLVSENFPTLYTLDFLRSDTVPEHFLESVSLEKKEIYRGS